MSFIVRDAIHLEQTESVLPNVKRDGVDGNYVDSVSTTVILRKPMVVR